jgi:hypothetical protein
MSKNPIQQKQKRKKRDEVASIIADIHGVTPAYVRMVINGEKQNDAILIDYLTYNQEKNKLIQSLKQTVPFTNN